MASSSDSTPASSDELEMLHELSAGGGADDEAVGRTLLAVLRFRLCCLEAAAAVDFDKLLDISSSSWLVEICANAVFLGVGRIRGDSEGFSLLLDVEVGLEEGSCSSSLEYDEAENVTNLVKKITC